MLEEIIKEYEDLDKRDLEIVNQKQEVLQKNDKIFKAITKLEEEAGNIAKARETVKEKLMEAMDLISVKKFENDYLTLTYVDSTTATTIDTAKLKEKYPDIASECSKTSTRKAYLKIKIKEAE